MSNFKKTDFTLWTHYELTSFLPPLLQHTFFPSPLHPNTVIFIKSGCSVYITTVFRCYPKGAQSKPPSQFPPLFPRGQIILFLNLFGFLNTYGSLSPKLFTTYVNILLGCLILGIPSVSSSQRSRSSGALFSSVPGALHPQRLFYPFQRNKASPIGRAGSMAVSWIEYKERERRSGDLVVSQTFQWSPWF